MHSDKDDRTYPLDEEHLRILQETEKTTPESAKNEIREGLDMYIRSPKGGDANDISIFSPIVFDRPYRSRDQ